MSVPKMSPLSPEWDYLIITATNEGQATAYRSLIDLRITFRFITGAKKILVVADPDGRRVGSGGSTIHCLLHVLNLESEDRRRRHERIDPCDWSDIFNRLRILIVHAGGDSRRLPPYSPCGKIFVPVPGEMGGALGTTLFDRLIPTYLELPRPLSGGGQIVIATGDVLLDFDASSVKFSGEGITGVGALVSPEVAKNHGVYSRQDDGTVRLFLQKPSVTKQSETGAIDSHGQAVLDIGILNFAPEAAVRLLELCNVGMDPKNGGRLIWRGPLAGVIETEGLDIYREVCCALGQEVSYSGYADQMKEAGAKIDSGVLRTLYRGLRAIPFRVHLTPHFRFLHFGTLQDLIGSGRSLISTEMDVDAGKKVILNSRLENAALVQGRDVWIEGCRVQAPLDLAGDNVVVGVDIAEPLSLPRGGCLDIIKGRLRDGRMGWFVRVFSADDTFHLPAIRGSRICGKLTLSWLEEMGASPEDIWDGEIRLEERSVWNGRFFPSTRKNDGGLKWLWTLKPGKASTAQKKSWLAADRYSLAEMAIRADLDSFHSRRLKIRGEIALGTLSKVLGSDGQFSAAEISFLIKNAARDKRAGWTIAMIREAIRVHEAGRSYQGLDSLGLSRILHTLGSVLPQIAKANVGGRARDNRKLAEALSAGLTGAERRMLKSIDAPVKDAAKPALWAAELKDAAFRHLGRTIVYRAGGVSFPPKNVLRSDEIVWGRSPARLDLGGGWTDTPPYSLEHGGCVINAAVTLNGQAPIQAYARVIKEREIRINSIDHSTRLVVRTLKDLLDYGKPGSQFALAKAALGLAGFAPEAAAWPAEGKTLEGMLHYFGGGIELTTLAAIPSGSGLGTSSIMGAVLMSIIGRVIGRPVADRELFHAVLKLEQELTTGGGWQDQIGGVIEGVKMITAERGLVPDPRIHFVPSDLLDPEANGGRTLLYYTGLRRLAKNILHEVVGRYLDRDRSAMETLRRLHAFPPLMAEAMGMRDVERFGELIELAWKLNVDLDPDHTTSVIEGLRERIRPHVLGAKLLGAGGGGFLLIVCKSSEHAKTVRVILEKHPPNDKARFFEYSISRSGLVVTVC